MSVPSTTSEPAWSNGELAGDVHTREDKARRVQSMFGAIAGRYDLNNRVHSFGRDQSWRRAAVRMAEIDGDTRVLDVACGTGDMSRLCARAGAGHVTGMDFTPEMLEIARRKSPSEIEFIEGDAMDLPFEDESFDVLTTAFGIRNVTDPREALRQFYRVLTPGGRCVVLEFSEPRSRVLCAMSRLYTHRVMPVTASVLAGDRSGAYKYLPRSVITFLDRESLQSALEKVGFERVRQRVMTFGVCVCYVGHKPE
ncbi:MAG: bifunctional demethylmenaquinone methyltransferase/2-methoxy-6-polyprenyl-1,4-benzoquinol methylase UbiE [Planctomycetota bacterium]